MTLNLTHINDEFVMQVSDRLLTLIPGGRSFDELANKNLVFLAKDGLISLGYTGAAYIEGVPTDRWLARKLALDESLQVDGQGAVETGFELPRYWMDVGRALAHIAERLTEVWHRKRYPPAGLTIFAAGWQWPARGWNWKLGRSRPVYWLIFDQGASRVFRTACAERYWGWERSQVYLSALPDSWVATERLARLAYEVGGASAVSEIEELLVGAVREVATASPAVGSDCMVIFIPTPRLLRTVLARYAPAPDSVGDRARFAYTPWVITPDARVSPTIINGGRLEIPSGPFTFRFEGPEELTVNPDGSIVIFQSQPRPPGPSW